MAKAYSMDLRNRVIAACDAGEMTEKVALRFGVSARAIYKWFRLRKETGSLTPRHSRPGRKPALAKHANRLRELVAKHPDDTLQELVTKLPVKVSTSTLWETLHRLGISFKKSHPRRRATTS
jgi:transposase